MASNQRSVTRYMVDFDDGSFYSNISPKDITNYDCLQMGAPPIGADVVVRWSDGCTYRGKYRGQRQINAQKWFYRPRQSLYDHQEKNKVSVKRPNPFPQLNPVQKRSQFNQRQLELRDSPQSPSITPLMEQLDSVDNAPRKTSPNIIYSWLLG